jgi:uncharacterized membrane protein
MYLVRDPGLEITAVPSFHIATSYVGDAGLRAMRLYFPRTLESLGFYDVLILSDTGINLFTPLQLQWLATAVRDHGSGLGMIGGVDSFGDQWCSSHLGCVLPMESGEEIWSPARIAWVDDEDPLISSLPFSEIGEHGEFSGFNAVEARAGSSVTSIADTQYGPFPFMLDWEFGEGRSFAFASEWKGKCVPVFCREIEECHHGGTCWGDNFATWEYYPEFAINLVRFLASRELVDVEVRKEYGETADEFRMKRMLSLSLVDFLDRMGIKVERLRRVIADSDSEMDNARDLYAGGNWEQSLECASSAVSHLSSIPTLADEMKSSSMLWIHIAEFSLTLAAILISGVTLDSLYASRKAKHGRE